MAEIPYPVPSRKLDDRLAFVRQEARKIVECEVQGEVAVLDAAVRIHHELGYTRWTQRRYAHFTLTEDELAAIHAFVDTERWRVSGEETSREAQRLARRLLEVGLSRG